jgi:ubiquinone/menaquinone biosynthesis C-methylase UbiE
MPFADNTFDFVICTSAFKNFSQPAGALSEMDCVLKPGGKAWISDLRRDVSDETISSFVRETMKARGLDGWFIRFTFRRMLRPRAHTAGQIEGLVSKTRFRKCDVRENPMDLEVLLEK